MGNVVYAVDVAKDEGSWYIPLMVSLDATGLLAGIIMLHTIKVKKFWRSLGQRIVCINVVFLFLMSFTRVLIILTNSFFFSSLCATPECQLVPGKEGNVFFGNPKLEFTCFPQKFVEYMTISSKAPLNACYLIWYKYYVMRPMQTHELPDKRMFWKWMYFLFFMFMLYFGLRVMFIDTWVVTEVFCDGESDKFGLYVAHYTTRLLATFVSMGIVLVLLYQIHFKKYDDVDISALGEYGADLKSGVQDEDVNKSLTESEHSDILRAQSKLEHQRHVYKHLLTFLSLGFLVCNTPQIVSGIPNLFSASMLQLLFHVSSAQNIWDAVCLHYFVFRQF